jgi:hypothetical protein
VQYQAFIWNVHTIAVGGTAKIRMYRLSTTGTTPLNVVDFSATSAVHHLFNASIATTYQLGGASAFISASLTVPSDAVLGKPTFVTFYGPNNSSAGWALNGVIASSSVCINNSSSDCPWAFSSAQIAWPDVNQAWLFNQLQTGTLFSDWTTRGALITRPVAGPMAQK